MGCCGTAFDHSSGSRKAWTVLACISSAWCLHVSAQHAASPVCHYGTLPGGWIRAPNRLQPSDARLSPEAFPVWQPYNLACQLRPLLIDYLQVQLSNCSLCKICLCSTWLTDHALFAAGRRRAGQE